MTVSDAVSRGRRFVSAALGVIEDGVYVGLGVVLAATAIYLLFSVLFNLAIAVDKRTLTGEIIGLLDQVLLILLVVELLYTVQVSFRKHALAAQPFLVVALIATIRKILVLTAQMSEMPNVSEIPFQHSMAELGLLSVMMLVLVGSLILLQRHPAPVHEAVEGKQFE